MSRTVTAELLEAFTNEAQEHLAEIGPVVAELAAADKEAMKQAFRHSHNLKGSASLLGFSTLSHVARVQEEILEALWTDERQLSDEIQQLIDLTFRAIVMCIHSSAGHPMVDVEILESVLIPYRRLMNLPQDGDAGAIRELLPTTPTIDLPVTPVPESPTAATAPARLSKAKKKSKAKQYATSLAAAPAEKPQPIVSPQPIALAASNELTAEVLGWLHEMAAVDAEYAGIYAEESEESVRSLRRTLDELQSDVTDNDNIQAVRRLMHNLKGASATVGFKAISKLAHRAENVLDKIADGEAGMSLDLVPLLHNVVDTMEDLASRTFDLDAMSGRLAEMLTRLDGTATGETAPVSGTALAAGCVDLLNDTMLAGCVDSPAASSPLKNSWHGLPGRDSCGVSDMGKMPMPLFQRAASAVPLTKSAIPNAEERTRAACATEETTEQRILSTLEALTPAFIDIDAVLPPTVGALIPSVNEMSKRDSNSSTTGESVRVPIEKLDALVRLVTEPIVNRSSFEQKMQGMKSVVGELRFSLKRIQELSGKFAIDLETKTSSGKITMSWERAGRDMPIVGHVSNMPVLRHDGHVENVPHAGEFDPLEMDRYTEQHILSRSLNEAASDIHTVQGELGNLAGDFDQLLNQQGLISRDLQDRLMRARLVPFGTLGSRLSRTVRSAAEEVHKNVRLQLDGDTVPLDKSVLESLVDPLTHLLRNAVDHGIEAADLRATSGKEAEALIRLRAFHQGTQVVLQISDDGRGLDLEALRDKAVRDGHVSAGDAEILTKTDLQNLIFVHGLSTAATVSELSGRGVGMDVVRTAVHKLKGTISVDSTPEQGTTFTIRLPMTLAITEALFVEAAHEKFAIPLQDVLQIIRLERKELDRVGSSPVLRMGGRVYPLIHLRDALHLEAPADEATANIPVLFVNVGDKQVAFAVDRIIATREIVVKTLGTHYRRVHGLIGATLMGDGTVVPILNCGEVLEAPATRSSFSADTEDDNEDTGGVEQITVMIVDDSVSVRRVTQKILSNAGMETILCRDGVDALETLQRLTSPPDLVLLDVEMPRMDGYELLSSLRSQPDYESLPIVMVTSRSGDKHRTKAEQLGSTDYLVKPYDEDQLIATIQQHVAEARELVLSCE